MLVCHVHAWKNVRLAARLTVRLRLHHALEVRRRESRIDGTLRPAPVVGGGEREREEGGSVCRSSLLSPNQPADAAHHRERSVILLRRRCPSTRTNCE
jgi:hypothetical protein